MCAAVTAAIPLISEINATATTTGGNGIGNAISETENVTTSNANGVLAGAGAGTIQKSTAICRYYLRGICRFGSLCRFSHDAIGGEILSSSSHVVNDESGTAVHMTKASTSAAAAKNTDFKLTNWANAPAFIPSGKMFYYNTNNNDQRNNIVDHDIENLNVNVVAAAADKAEGVGATISNNKTWAEIVGGDAAATNASAAASYVQFSAPASVDILCPYESPCPYVDYCAYTMHLELCKMCDMYVLHPSDLEQRRKHNQECLLQHERDMELSFAIARSRDKTCGICMDIIMEKTGREKRFGILPNCTHIFCLECIRKWRQAKQFEHKITRSCPECRIASDFVCPSAFWVETKEEKEKLLSDYRAALGVKDCKYFKKGSGKCPFGNKCFYKHALANGELVDVGCPRRSRKLLHQTSELIDLLDIYLWEFVDHRDYNFLDLFSNTSDLSDDSDLDA